MRILVTGTTGGIGGAFAAVAQTAGHEVIAINRADFADLAAALAARRVQGLDAVVFATGTCPVTPITRLDDDAFTATLTVNCTYFLALMRELVRTGAFAARAQAVAVSSVSAREGWAGGAAYCASKGALSALCRALDAELKPRGIAVTAIEPRYVRTRMFREGAMRMGVREDEAEAPEAFALRILKGIES